mgnify:CR=1 FL=1|tara:strand:+ start:384 stop:791 length:408 start_codon:yes stop_codon:yes gene_type:complete
MAFNRRQISPIDLNKSKAVGVDIIFNGPAVFKSNFTTSAAIKNNLINYFLTNPGERPLNPSFGGGLRSFIFEQISTNNIKFLKNTISTNISKKFPTIIVEELKISEHPDTNIIRVSLDYRISRTNISDNIQIDFQ